MSPPVIPADGENPVAKDGDRVTKKRGRSELIDRAIISYISGISKKNIRTQLKEGYERHARHDLEMAQEWFSLEEEAWNADKEERT